MKTGTLWIGVAALVFTVACNRNDAQTGSVVGDRAEAKITLTGCLQSGEQGLASREPNSASRSAEGVDQFVLTNAKMPGSPATDSAGSLYVLEGEKGELQQHVGQQVEVTGESKENAPADPNQANVKRLDVESVRMITERCSGI